MREHPKLRDLLGQPLDDAQLAEAREITVANGAMDLAMGVANDHAVKASEALDGAEGLDPATTRTLITLVDGLVGRSY